MDLPDGNSRSNLISVPTVQLRDRLNRLYAAVRDNPKTLAGRFDYLWDLKELAVLEGKGSVQIPDMWLDELERMFVESADTTGRSH